MIFKRSFFLTMLLISVSCADPKKEIPIQMRNLHSKSTRERSQAALKIGRIGPPHANIATRDLIRLLKDENAGVRSAAAYALRQIDTPTARKALEQASK